MTPEPDSPHVSTENPQHETAFTNLLEKDKRLSECLLWQAQRSYFERSGVEAWRTTTVPHYITCNPRLASSYAETVLGYLRDAQARQWLDPSQPLYIVELGSGSGRFGFLFLRTFSHLVRRSSLPPLRFCYVMTDLAERNLEFLRSHQALQPLIEQGILDFGLFDVEHGSHIQLQHGRETLSARSLRNPLVVIANYVFDGVSQDAFLVKDGELFERLISVYSDVPAPDLGGPDTFGHLAVTYGECSAPLNFYPEPEFNAILQDYTRTMKETTILFPSAALRCIQRLAEFSSGRLLLLSSDKGEVDDDFLDGASDPGFVVHGSFSLSVNYHAIGEYVVKKGGEALMMEHRPVGLNTSAFLLGTPPGTLRETTLAYHRFLGSGAADDFFVLRRGLQERYDQLELKHLLALLRLSDYDPRIMGICLPAVWAKLEDADEAIRTELSRTVLEVWERYYHLGEDYDLAFDLACLLYGLDQYQPALRLFDESCRLYGDDPRALWNKGLCYCGLKDNENALRCFTRSLNADGFAPAGGLQGKDPRLT